MFAKYSFGYKKMCYPEVSAHGPVSRWQTVPRGSCRKPAARVSYSCRDARRMHVSLHEPSCKQGAPFGSHVCSSLFAQKDSHPSISTGTKVFLFCGTTQIGLLSPLCHALVIHVPLLTDGNSVRYYWISAGAQIVLPALISPFNMFVLL